jgi:hypothetical protein
VLSTGFAYLLVVISGSTVTHPVCNKDQSVSRRTSIWWLTSGDRPWGQGEAEAVAAVADAGGFEVGW